MLLDLQQGVLGLANVGTPVLFIAIVFDKNPDNHYFDQQLRSLDFFEKVSSSLVLLARSHEF